ncbi:MAG TPA: hypothetical protein VF783_04530 [Terriglobales bacterium]
MFCFVPYDPTGAELWFRTLVECAAFIGWRHEELESPSQHRKHYTYNSLACCQLRLVAGSFTRFTHISLIPCCAAVSIFISSFSSFLSLYYIATTRLFIGDSRIFDLQQVRYRSTTALQGITVC